MIGIPNFDVTNPTGKQKFVDYIINLVRNEIISFTSSYNDNDNTASTGVLPNGLVPAGTIVMYGGTVLPDGYLWCDGTQQLIASYTSLFIALGVNRYGVDTATQFYLPNLTSRLPRGAATTAGVVTTNNNNTHGHTLNASNVNATTATASSTSTSSDGAHNHNNNGANTGGNDNNNSFRFPASGTLITVAANGHAHGVNGSNTIGTGGHNHNVNAATITVTSGTVVTGSVNDNTTYVPAFVEVNYIIKT